MSLSARMPTTWASSKLTCGEKTPRPPGEGSSLRPVGSWGSEHRAAPPVGDSWPFAPANEQGSQVREKAGAERVPWRRQAAEAGGASPGSKSSPVRDCSGPGAPAGQPASQQTPGVLRGSPEPCGRLGACAGTPRCKRCSRRSTLAPRPLPPHILRGLGDRAGPAGRPAQVAGSRTDFLPQNDLNGLALPTCLGQVGMAVTQENTGDEIAAHAPARKEAGAGPPAGGRRALSPDPHARAHTHSHAHTLTRSHTHACTLTRPRMLTLTGAHVHTHTHTLMRAHRLTHSHTLTRSPPPPRSVCRPLPHSGPLTPRDSLARRGSGTPSSGASASQGLPVSENKRQALDARHERPQDRQSAGPSGHARHRQTRARRVSHRGGRGLPAAAGPGGHVNTCSAWHHSLFCFSAVDT